jgi:riboflavin synthase
LKNISDIIFNRTRKRRASKRAHVIGVPSIGNLPRAVAQFVESESVWRVIFGLGGKNEKENDSREGA